MAAPFTPNQLAMADNGAGGQRPGTETANRAI